MGHERIGLLPKTQSWRDIVAGLEAAASSDQQTSQTAQKTLSKVRDRFAKMHRDSGVQAAFGFFVGLACIGKPKHTGKASPEIDLSRNPSPLHLAAALNKWVDAHLSSREYAELAKRAGGDVIAAWHLENHRQRTLFSPTGPTASEIWLRTSQGGVFSEVARLFLARFTERYLRYFLEREASAQILDLENRESFEHRLREQVDNVSRHAFETSKITQSFAAGWFNKHAKNNIPSDAALAGFLRVAFAKLREELRREADK